MTLRVDVTDPMQRTYSAYAFHVIEVLSGADPTEGDSGLFIGESGGGSSGGGPGSTGDTTGAPGGSSGAVETGEPKIDEATGCGCDSGGAGGAWGLALVGLVVRRRKRGSTLGPS